MGDSIDAILKLNFLINDVIFIIVNKYFNRFISINLLTLSLIMLVLTNLCMYYIGTSVVIVFFFWTSCIDRKCDKIGWNLNVSLE
jgi:hypothetical protein